jgi:hypothetical protein
MKMGRHRSPSGIELPVEVGELTASVLQEKSPAQGEECGGQIYEKDRDRDQYRRKVMLHEQESVGRKEAKFVCQKEKDRQGYNRSGKEGIGDHLVASLVNA